MTISRYGNKKVLINRLKEYKNLFKSRGVNQIRQFGTPKLSYPTDEQLSTLNIVSYYWKEGDRYFKVASEFYNDPTMWWVIAWFNAIPSETDIRPGDVIAIPTPLEDILNYYKV